MKESSGCAVCDNPDCEIIEVLLAKGAYVSDISKYYNIDTRTIQRHESLHSLKFPNIDPLFLLRQFRWIEEQSTNLCHQVFGGNNRISEKNVRIRKGVLELGLKVCTSMAEMLDFKRRIDPHVMLPRWTEVMSRLAEVLKDNKPALDALQAFMQEQAPGDTTLHLKARPFRKVMKVSEERKEKDKRPLTIDIEDLTPPEPEKPGELKCEWCPELFHKEMTRRLHEGREHPIEVRRRAKLRKLLKVDALVHECHCGKKFLSKSQRLRHQWKDHKEEMLAIKNAAQAKAREELSKIVQSVGAEQP